MKIVRKKSKISKFLLTVLGLLAIVTGISLASMPANAASDELQMKPGETGNIYYDTNNIYTMSGTKHGAPWSDETAVMAVSPDNGSNQKIVFCIEPGVPFTSTDNPGYEAVGVNDIPQDAQIASVIWNTFYAFGDNWTIADRITAQAVIWELLPQYGIKVDAISGIPDFQARKQKLYAGIEEYKRLPEFNKSTVDLTFGETKRLNSSVDLHSFETLVSNSAKVNWNVAADGKSVDVTPTDPSVQSGQLIYKRSFMEGTPIALEKQGSQTVYLPSVKDPNLYVVNFNIKTTGDISIKKVDKETGDVVPNTEFKVEFSGNGAPATQMVKTNKNGLATIKGINHKVHVKATEISVPNPYVLGSALGESDVVEGDVVAGQEITLTQRNMKAKGQILIEKQGIESGHELWNANYSLAGNVFEIHKDSETGEVISTITTDEKGHAETEKNLPLGTYVVTEKTASNGFANTFKPVTVKIEYAKQTTAVIIKGAEGKNQEVVGSTVLTKEDAETGNQTQGAASFVGAEYGLFHEDGTPVNWSENFKPELTNGTRVDGDSIVVRIDDKDQKAGVKHLALGKYFWKETKSPEGYQLDNTKREFEITYKDQNTQTVVTETVSKENVIKFTVDGFKYVESKSGSTKTGYNDIEFKLTPIKPTKGDVRTTKTVTDENGYDGYWKFAEIPYGDYELTEVKAPEGYKTIEPLIIKSVFNKDKREYVFTIAEKGQKEILKTLTVPESKINEGSNVINLSKLFLDNNLVKIPEIRTLATVNGEKTFTLAKDTSMHDDIQISNVVKGDKYTNKIKLWKIQNGDTKNAKVVFETSKDFVAKADSEKQVIDTLVDTSKDDEKTSYVWTEELYDKSGSKVAEHNDLTNKDQTVTPKVKEVAKTSVKPATPTSSKVSGTLPQTSGTLGNPFVWIAVVLVLAAGAVFVFMKKKHQEQH
ncbi:hypothetical protein IGI39_004752 [Enterococcus sp. AZ135]|uniref:SpaA isopeptide-forming pilin-related protein n=1 Tax=unclassified Enterococcus TaxID=2608891 RepID=UPI003F28B7F3